MKNPERILRLMEDKRMGISLLSIPVPEYQKWLHKSIELFEKMDIPNIEKELQKILGYTKLLKSKGIMEVSLKNKENAILHFGECYSFHQKYFFCNEVINYGFFQQCILDKIEKYGLDVNQTLKELTFFKRSHFIKGNLKENQKGIVSNSIPEEILELYSKLLDMQSVLFEINENLSEVYGELNKKYGIEKEYKQKANLIGYYLANTSYSKYRVSDKKVFYKKYLFLMDSGNVFEISQELMDSLNFILSRERFVIPAVKVNEKLNKLLKEKILTDKKYDEKPEYYRIFFELTPNCNLNCRYCFNRGVKRYFSLEKRDWLYIMNFLPENTQVNLFGGEPFESDCIEEVILGLDDLLQKKKILEVRCFTNATNTDRILSVLKKVKSRFLILISLDGSEEQSDKIRGKGNFRKTVETIRRIKKETNHIIWVKSLITELNYDSIEKFVYFLDGLGVDYFSLGELQLAGNAVGKESEMISFEKEFELINKVRETNTKLKIKDDDILQDFLVNRCGYGYCLVYIRSDGFIGGCTENDNCFNHIFELYSKMNEFKENPMKLVPDFFKTGMVDSESKCFSCHYVNLCMGGCYARALRENSDCDTFRRGKIEFLLEKLVKEHLE